jgi:hypothetical protein
MYIWTFVRLEAKTKLMLETKLADIRNLTHQDQLTYQGSLSNRIRNATGA